MSKSLKFVKITCILVFSDNNSSVRKCSICNCEINTLYTNDMYANEMYANERLPINRFLGRDNPYVNNTNHRPICS